MFKLLSFGTLFVFLFWVVNSRPTHSEPGHDADFTSLDSTALAERDDGQYPFSFDAWTSPDYKGHHYSKMGLVPIKHNATGVSSTCHTFTHTVNDKVRSYKWLPLTDAENMEIWFYVDASCHGYIDNISQRGMKNKANTRDLRGVSSFKVHHYVPNIFLRDTVDYVRGAEGDD
ncbi:hypothetical protein BJ138DRAFT_1158760 [Hygrophoropsis aurantiaca]|uniref:Uncharacterized protein n=1 Tax=Hygrophoropsis aurantiaca TaxID=72124 RepID=A0ACB8A4I9_9AGAM|nr:hypothetical protein BJ138DRAFT_1158760 [Hygrophoropsis aurantiaca]